MSIKFRLLCFFTIIIVIMTFIIASVSYEHSRKVIENGILEKTKELFVVHEQKILERTTRDQKNVLLLAHSPVVRALISGGAAKYADDSAGLFRSFILRFNTYQQLRLLSLDGQELVRVNRDDNGEIIRTEDRQLQSKKDRPYFKEAIRLSLDQIYISELNLNRENGRLEVPNRPMLRYATPVYDFDGVKAGVMVINVDARNLLNFLNNIDGFMYMCNEDGYFLRHRESSKEFGFEFSGDFSLKDEFPDLLQELSYQDDFIGSYSAHEVSSGKDVTLGFKKVRFDPRNEHRYWSLIYELESAPLFQPVTELLKQYVMIGFGIIIVGILLAYLLAISLSKPIERLTDVSREIEGGNFDVEVRDLNRNDEIGVLASSLQSMVSHLKQRNLEKAHQIWLKTKQAEFSDLSSKMDAVDELCRQALFAISKEMGAYCGLMYLVDEDGKAKVSASYSNAAVQEGKKSFLSGEGLVGQVMLSKGPIRINGIADTNLRMQSGIIDVVPKDVLIYPVLYYENAVGVLELGFLEQCPDETLEYLESIVEQLGVAIDGLRSRERLQLLYEKTSELTELLQAQQEELRQSNEELESINEELEERKEALERQRRTLIDKNSELEESRIALRSQAADLKLASQYKSEFLANMSHELRTPLNSMLILSRMLSENQNHSLSESEVEYAKTIYDSGQDLLSLIDDVLDLAKVEAGKLSLQLADVDINEVLDRLRRVFNPLASRNGVDLVIVNKTGLKSLVTDSMRLEQILKNLLSNAVKFTEHGQVSLEVSQVSAEEIVFTVADTGIGIPSEQLQSVFQSFHQVDSGINRKYAGTGLGLSIVQQLVELLGGTVSVTSVEGSGSQFTVTVPVKQKTEVTVFEAEEWVAKKDNKDESQSADSLKSVVLIIDDRDEFVAQVQNTAMANGYTVVESKSGAVGIHLAQTLLPVAIILNWDLPGLSGVEVLAELQRDQRTNSIPVFISEACLSGSELNERGIMGVINGKEKDVALEIEDIFDSLQQTGDVALVVENEEAQIVAISNALKPYFKEVLIARNGADALEQMRLCRVDCVVLDLNLDGEIDGADIVREIQSNDELGDPGIVIYTGIDLSPGLRERLSKQTRSIVAKGAGADQILLEEVTLFLNEVESNLSDEQRLGLRKKYERDRELNGKRVLLVDDDMRNIFAMTSVLERNGVEVLVANTGAEALLKISEDVKIDLIYMDLMMPEMDGFEATTAIRQIPEYEQVPVIVLTAQAGSDSRSKALACGASDWLQKPIEKDVLLSLTRIWLYREG